MEVICAPAIFRVPAGPPFAVMQYRRLNLQSPPAIVAQFPEKHELERHLCIILIIILIVIIIIIIIIIILIIKAESLIATITSLRPESLLQCKCMQHR